MPVSASTVQFSYTGDGVTTTFAFPSRFLTSSDLIVGVNGVQVLSGFNVTGAGNDAGGNVVFSVAPANGATVTLIRAPAISQLLDFVNNQTVLAQNIDNGLDKLTIIAQYLDYLLARTLRLSQFDTSLSGDYDANGKSLKNLKAPVDAADAARLSDLQGVVAGTGNVPAPTGGQIGFILKALAANSFGWVAEGNPLAPDGTLAAPGYGFASETGSGFRRASAGVVEAVVLGAAKLAFESAAVRLSTSLLLTNGAVTAGTDAQGQGAITTDLAFVTSTPNNPSGVTLPVPVAGRRVFVVNRGTNPINIYPSAGTNYMGFAVNAPQLLPVGQSVEFVARSGSQWVGQIEQPYDADLAAIAAVARSRGMVLRGGASAWEGLALGTTGFGLVSDGTDLVFRQVTPVNRSTLTTTSGTTVTFGSIPAALDYVEFFLRGVSSNGSDDLLLRLGTAGGLVSAGYTGGVFASQGGAVANQGETTGLVLEASAGAQEFRGCIKCRRIERGSNLWNLEAVVTRTSGPGHLFAVSQVDLGAELTQAQFLWSGAGSFDLGSITAAW